jgi:hypothetical protein
MIPSADWKARPSLRVRYGADFAQISLGSIFLIYEDLRNLRIPNANLWRI